MEKKSSNGFFKAIIFIVIAIFALNAISTGSIFKKLTEKIFKDDSSVYSYVHDEANVLTDSTIDYINNMNASLDYQTGAQIIVVTINSLEGEDAADKAYSLFNTYTPGDDTDNNGVLLLFSIEDNNSYALQGRGIESALTSGKLQLMLNETTEESFAAGNYDSGIKNMFDEVSEFLEKIYAVTLSSEYSYSHYSTGASTGLIDSAGVLISSATGIAKKIIKAIITGFFILFGLIALIIVLVLFNKDKKNQKDNPNAEPISNTKKENKNPYSSK